MRDLTRILSLSHSANFSVPGAGKTTVAYATYEAERQSGRVSRLLVIGPISAFESWIAEARLCFTVPPRIQVYSGIRPRAETEVLLVNYQRFYLSYDDIAAWASQHRTHVILDEAHRMKRGRDGEWGTACLDLAYLAARRDILTGTPAPNAPGDLEALIGFLWPNQARRILPSDALLPSPPSDVGPRIAQAIRPLFARTTKRELVLPSPTFQALKVPLEGLHADIYHALIDRYAGQLSVGSVERVDFVRLGRITMYLLEAACNPALLTAGSSRDDPIEFRHPPLVIEPGSSLAEVLRRYSDYEVPRKFVELGRIVKANAEQNRKTLVWSTFVRNLATLKRMLAVYEPAIVHGGVPPAESAPSAPLTRDAELRRFREDPNCMVLLANPAAMGEGVSLHQTCHDAVYLDRTFNAGQYLQSLDRIHRLGLGPNDETRFTFLLTEGTVDMVVDGRVGLKAARLGAMLDDPDIATMALPDEDDYGPVVDSVEDVNALLRHLRGENA
ncbi:MAG: SNF2-related protein [Phycisphaerales bacterium]